MIRRLAASIRRWREGQRGELTQRHLNQPGIRPDQIATGSITADNLAAGPYEGPHAVNAPPPEDRRK